MPGRPPEDTHGFFFGIFIFFWFSRCYAKTPKLFEITLSGDITWDAHKHTYLVWMWKHGLMEFDNAGWMHVTRHGGREACWGGGVACKVRTALWMDEGNVWGTTAWSNGLVERCRDASAATQWDDRMEKCSNARVKRLMGWRGKASWQQCEWAERWKAMSET